MLQLRFMPRTMQDLEGIYPLALALAHHLPQPDAVVIGIHELLMNAVEHGNLGVGFETKTELLRQGTWHSEMERRLAMAEYAGRAVEVELTKEFEQTILTISDAGSGFRWREFIAREQCFDRPNGRGLWVAFKSPFESIAFNDAGNTVICRMMTRQRKPRILAKYAVG